MKKIDENKINELKLVVEKSNNEIEEINKKYKSELINAQEVYVGRCFQKKDVFIKIMGVKKDSCSYDFGQFCVIQIDFEEPFDISRYLRYETLNEIKAFGYKEISNEQFDDEVLKRATKCITNLFKI